MSEQDLPERVQESKAYCAKTHNVEMGTEIKRRIHTLEAIESQGLEAVALRHMATDPVLWMNEFMWTYDPRNPEKGMPGAVPMVLFERQVEMVHWMRRNRKLGVNGQLPKSRGTGASYGAIGQCDHAWLFEPDYNAMLMTFGQNELDSIGDPSSMFGKVRFILEMLPRWMLPKGFELGGQYDNYMRMINPVNGNTITGVLPHKAGRSGRFSEAIVDEAAHIDKLSEARRALQNATNCRQEISTPNGPGEPFHHTVMSAPPAQVFWFPWKDVPWYDQAWYDKMRTKYIMDGDLAGFAQEVDMDFLGSQEGGVIQSAWVQAAIEWTPQGPLKDVPNEWGYDIANGGDNESVLIRRNGPIVQMPHSTQQAGTTRLARWARDIIGEDVLDRVTYDADGIGSAVGDAWQEDDVPPKFNAVAFRGGAAPTDKYWASGKTSKERFFNLKAESWWGLRERLRKTHDLVLYLAGDPDGKEHPVDECISLPDHPKLAMQLTQPKYETRSRGRTIIESKQDLRKRGVSSPDYADALVMAFAPSAYAEVEFFI